MPDAKVSALVAATVPLAGTEELPIVQGGVSRKVTVADLRNPNYEVHNAAIAAQGPGFAADTYLTNSNCLLPANRAFQAKTKYRCRIMATKTAAGAATPIISLRIGTAGTTADASRVALTFAAQTAAADEAVIELMATFRTVGTGTAATVHMFGIIDHRLATTGFATVNESIVNGVSTGFDSTTAGVHVGLSVNGGTSAAWTVQAVQAELLNLA